MRSKNVLTFPPRKERRKTIIMKIIDFFPTPVGRKVSFFAVGTVAAGALFGNYLPQTILFEEYRDYVLQPSMWDIWGRTLSNDMRVI